MTRKETLFALIRQAQANGFDFCSWFQKNISPDWQGAEQATAFLCLEGRWYSLVFSHDFARAMWKQGAKFEFEVPTKTFLRVNGKGEVVTIHRKSYTRRTIRPDVWKYHLHQMAISDDPIHYLNRFHLTVSTEPQNIAESRKVAKRRKRATPRLVAAD